MNAEILSIGTELLIGSILNTNARFLSEQLARNAVDVYRQTTVGDNGERIIECLQTAFGRADIVITSGGLGPTEDDVTVRSFAKFLNRPLVFHQPTYHYIQKRLKDRKFAVTRLIARQCYVPKDSIVLKNEKGTAPGIVCQVPCKNRKKWAVLLPGPPRELEPLFTQKVLPLLNRLAGIPKERFIIRSLKITGLTEAQVAQKAGNLLRLKPPLTLGIYAKQGEVELKIMAKASSQKKAQNLASGLEKTLRARLKGSLFGADDETLSSAVGRLLREKRQTLSVAESCTGGLLSACITETPGASEYFLGGIVSYHNRIKTSELGIPEALIQKHGAVSMAAAKKMAENIRRIFDSDFGIGITGIAGPRGGSPKKPVGLVYVALAKKGRGSCKKFRFFGNRSEIRSRASSAALNLLRLTLTSK